ncbi:hypothetical protein ANRL4_02567 [Anaerolineae bacterium]|nr:hypothetical protein ANRL4_02567 [Anaerolineae bacterium]
MPDATKFGGQSFGKMYKKLISPKKTMPQPILAHPKTQSGLFEFPMNIGGQRVKCDSLMGANIRIHKRTRE